MARPLSQSLSTSKSGPSPLVEQSVSLAAFASLAVQIWDMLACFTDEVEYLWRGRFAFIKALYFCSRHLMLIGQIINQYLSSKYDRNLTHSWLCPGIFIYKTVLSQIALLLLEMILFIRMYALYNQGYISRRFFFLVFMTSTTLELTGTGMVIQSFIGIPGCAARQASLKGIKLFGAGAGLAQLVIIISTLIKLISRRRLGWARTPLTSLMLKQGLSTFFLVLALVAVMITYGVVLEIDVDTGDAVLSWYVTLLSIGASRLVLHMRKLVLEHPGDDDVEDRNDHGTSHNSICLTTVSE